MDLFSVTNIQEIDNTMSVWLSRRFLSGNHDSEFYIRPIIIIYDVFSDASDSTREPTDSLIDPPHSPTPTLNLADITSELDDGPTDSPIELDDNPTLTLELADVTRELDDGPTDGQTPTRDDPVQINLWDDENSEYDYYEYENYDILHIPSGCVCLYDFDTDQHLLNNWIVENKYIPDLDIVFNTPAPAA